jgi:hypothetical protein
MQFMRLRPWAAASVLALLHNAGMARFFVFFLVILVALFTAELTSTVQNALVIPWTEALARISAATVTLFDANVISYGKILQTRAGGFAVSIETGYNGIEAANARRTKEQSELFECKITLGNPVGPTAT